MIKVRLRVRVRVRVRIRPRLRADQLEHGEPVADLAAVLLQELARQLEHVALGAWGLGWGGEAGRLAGSG